MRYFVIQFRNSVAYISVNFRLQQTAEESLLLLTYLKARAHARGIIDK